METNRLFMQTQLCLCSAKLMFLLPSVSNMIIDSASRWSVSKWLMVGRLLVGRFNETLKKHVWGSDFLACAFWLRIILLF